MAYQLIFTGYKNSLEKSDAGFATVARSKAMPKQLADAVGRYCGYGVESGTICSHRILNVEGTKYHLLSRAKDCGKFRDAPNYIVHHIVFTEGEADNISANPADIFLAFPQWFDSFYGDPRFLREIPVAEFCKASVSTLPAANWRATFGDCAYAAALRDSAKINAAPSDCATLLKLFGESLALVEHKHLEWDITFTTFLAPDANALDFDWVGGVYPQAEIDVPARKAKELPSGEAADYARSGVLSGADKLGAKIAGRVFKNKPLKHGSIFETSYTPIYIGAAVCVMIVAFIAVYLTLL